MPSQKTSPISWSMAVAFTCTLPPQVENTGGTIIGAGKRKTLAIGVYPAVTWTGI